MKVKIFAGIVAAIVVAVANPLREAQRELEIPHLFPPPHRGGG